MNIQTRAGSQIKLLITLFNNKAMKEQTYWEYKYIYQSTRTSRHYLQSGVDQIEDMLNEIGGEGWELVSVITTRGGLGAKIFRYFFKRPKLG